MAASSRSPCYLDRDAGPYSFFSCLCNLSAYLKKYPVFNRSCFPDPPPPLPITGWSFCKPPPPSLSYPAYGPGAGWLIQERINYKIIVTVYKCIHRLAPNYLSSILTTRTRDNRLRQKQVCHELNTHSCAKVVGKQAFGTRAPELWNKLPLNIRTIPTLQSFKQTLKTHLFQSAYRLLWLSQVFSLVFNKILKLWAHMTFYSVSAVIGYAAGYKRLKKYNSNDKKNEKVQCWFWT